MLIRDFHTKKSLQEYVRVILHEHRAGKRIDKSSPHFELMEDLIRNHYDSEERVGFGIDYFFVTPCDVNPRNAKFNIMRVDGTIEDFSYLRAIDGKTPTNKKYVKRAFRVAIQQQTMFFRDKFFRYYADDGGRCVCEVSGEKFRKDECHVDHRYPKTFDSLFYAFLKSRNLDMNKIEYDKSGDDDRPVLRDMKLVKDFQEWHAKNADMRCIHQRANGQGKKTKDFSGQDVHLVD